MVRQPSSHWQGPLYVEVVEELSPRQQAEKNVLEAHLALRAGRLEEADALTAEAVDLAPESASAWVLRAKALERVRQQGHDTNDGALLERSRAAHSRAANLLGMRAADRELGVHDGWSSESERMARQMRSLETSLAREFATGSRQREGRGGLR
ncbi:MAG: hypothetical protein AAF533_17080 [Acidobacteriota bacterium]